MGIYYFIFFWCILSGIVFFVLKNKFIAKRFYLLLNFVPIILFVGLRSSDNGRDTAMYIYLFNDFASYSWEEVFQIYPALEKGYIFLNKVTSWIYMDTTILFLLISFITFSGIAYFFYKNSFNPWLSVLIYIATCWVFEPMNTVRQSLAMGIVLIGYHFLKAEGKEKYAFFLFVIFASFFHYAALAFFILLIFLCKDVQQIKIYQIAKNFLYIFILGITTYYYFSFFIEISFVYSKYLGTEYLNGQMEPESIMYLLFRDFLLYGISIIGMLYGLLKNIYDQKEKIDVYYYCLFSFIAFILNIVGTFVPIIYRICFLFDIFVCTSIPLALKIFEYKSRYFMNLCMVLLWMIYFYLRINTMYGNGHLQIYKMVSIF